MNQYHGVAIPLIDISVTSYCNVALGGIPLRGRPLDP